MNRMWKLMLAAGLLLVPAGAFADDHASTDMTAAEMVDQETMGDMEDEYPTYEWGGWVDTALYGDNLAGGQDGKAGFFLSQVGFRLSHMINDNFGGFVQLNAFYGGARNAGLVAREAYGLYQSDGGFSLLAGKFYAPIGFELADPPDLYQYSNSLVFNNLIPTELVGVKAAYQFTDALDLQLYVSGPWDNDAAAAALGTKNIGGRLGVTIGDVAGFGLSAIGGPNDTNGDGNVQEGEMRIAVDLDGYVTPTEALLIGLEANVNMYEQATVSGTDEAYAMPFGALVMANYTFTDWFNATVRYDIVMDADVGSGADDPVGAPIFGAVGGNAQTRMSATVGPNFHLADGWDVFTEFRYDMSSEDAFLLSGDTTPSSGFMSGAVELIYQF